jgi:hypothetical protein
MCELQAMRAERKREIDQCRRMRDVGAVQDDVDGERQAEAAYFGRERELAGVGCPPSRLRCPAG